MFHVKGLCLYMLIALLLPGKVEAAAPGKGLFGSSEIHSKNMRSFGKWTEMWRRHNIPKAAVPKKAPGENYRCLGKFRAQCTREALEKFIAEQQTTDTLALLKSVNKYMNKSAYIVDPVNWGLPDYWATPSEFLMKDGDCEDYAIGKYVALKRLGVDIGAMRLVILQDENLRAAHAVLAVEVEGVSYILDNQVNAVLADTQILHYRPVYSINETGWWLHRVSRFTKRRY